MKRRRINFCIGLIFSAFLIGSYASGVQAQASPEATVFVDRAVLAYDEKRYDQALKELQEALRLDPNSADALYYQGLVYIALDRNADAQASLEKARGLRPEDPDIAFQLGVHYVNQQQFDPAEPLLRQVYKAEPRRPNIGYYLGLIELRKRNYREAVELFRAVVPSDENFAQLSRFYTGVAMRNLGLAREARAEIEEALRLQPVSPLTTPAQRFGEALRSAAERERFFRAELRFGIYYDTNVPVVPNISSGDTVTQTIREDQRRRKSEGELATLNLSYVLLRTLDWEGTVAYRFLQTYNNHLTEFNTQSHTPTLGLTYNRTFSPGISVLGLPYSAGLQFTYDFNTLGNKRFTQRWITNPYFSLQENSWNLTNLQFRLSVKDFFNDGEVSRAEVQDALNYMVGALHFFVFDQGRHNIKLGYQWDTDIAEGDNWDYWGHRLLVGGQYTLPWGDIRLRYDLDYNWRFHSHKHTLIPASATGTIRRRDQEAIHTFTIAKDFRADFAKSFPFAGCDATKDPKCSFTISLDYLFDNNNSNLQPYDYDRHVVTTSISWRF